MEEAARSLGGRAGERASGRGRAGKGWEWAKGGGRAGEEQGAESCGGGAAVACNRPLLGKWTGSMDQLEKERELKRPLSMAELLYETPHGLATV